MGPLAFSSPVSKKTSSVESDDHMSGRMRKISSLNAGHPSSLADSSTSTGTRDIAPPIRITLLQNPVHTLYRMMARVAVSGFIKYPSCGTFTPSALSRAPIGPVGEIMLE